MPLEVGRRLGPYEVVSLLGAGGMGEVYRAKDTRLGRTVALKVLTPWMTEDQDRLRRFEQEARMAGGLDHPNVLAIHDVGVDDGVPYLVSELLEGETLRQRLRTQPLSPEKAIDYAKQLASGLAAAHASGIIHRDLKPENLFVTNEGRIKILDFGLAKLSRPWEGLKLESVNETMSSPTSQSTVLGTPGYTSPEQVEGLPVNQASDIFSFGAVLYEMVTGERAFSGTTSAATMAAILKEEPRELASSTGRIPPALERILKQCLEKRPEHRFHSAHDLGLVLDGISGALGARVGLARTKPWVRVALVAFALLGAATAFVLGRKAGTIGDAKPPAVPAKVTQISHWNKPMWDASLAPDGHALAFASTASGVRQVFLMLTSGGDPLQLTTDEEDKYVFGFSQDGREIYYETSSLRDEMWAVPTLGGPPRRVASGRALTAAPDGNDLFYLKENNRAIFRSDKSGMNEQEVYRFDQPPLWPVFPILVFPDGRDLLVQAVESTWGLGESAIYKVGIATRAAVRLGSFSEFSRDLVWWKPGKTLLSSRTVAGLTNLWTYDLDTRAWTQVTFGAGPDHRPVPQPGGKGIYFVNGQRSDSLIAYNVHTGASTEVVSETAGFPRISPDGRRVMYTRVLGPERTELWVSDLDGSHKVKVPTSGIGNLGPGSWSPDGARLGFADWAKRLYTVGADGSGLRQMDGFAGSVVDLRWSRDGRTIYSVTEAGPKLTMWRGEATGSRAEEFLEDACLPQDTSADGRYLLCFIDMGPGMGIYQVSLAERKRMALLPGVATGAVAFAPDGRSFLYPTAGKGEVVFHRQGWREGRLVGQPQVALRLPFALSIYRVDFTPDLSTVVYLRTGAKDDLYLLSLSE